MATPKRKITRSRMRRRTTAYKMSVQLRAFNSVALTKCHQCKEMKPRHMLCPSCGAYSPSYDGSSLKQEMMAKQQELAGTKKVKKKAKKVEPKAAEVSREQTGIQPARELPHKAEDKGRADRTKSTFFRRKAGGGGS